MMGLENNDDLSHIGMPAGVPLTAGSWISRPADDVDPEDEDPEEDEIDDDEEEDEDIDVDEDEDPDDEEDDDDVEEPGGDYAELPARVEPTEPWPMP